VAGASTAVQEALQAFRRQALHAQRLVLTHPDTQERMSFEAPVPEDLRALLAALRADRREA
jgi:23S rRNA pseudouridine1911/1915/1917 synthase